MRIADEGAIAGDAARDIERSSIPPYRFLLCTSALEMIALCRLAALISAGPNLPIGGKRSAGSAWCPVPPAGPLMPNGPPMACANPSVRPGQLRKFVTPQSSGFIGSRLAIGSPYTQSKVIINAAAIISETGHE